MSEIPTREMLTRFALGDINATERASIESHLAEQPAARGFVENARRVIGTLEADAAAPRPSAATLRSAMGAWTARRRPLPLVWLEAADRLVARLVFDTMAGPALAGFRSDDAGRQLAFDAGGIRIDVGVTPPAAAGEPWSVRGRVGGDAADSVDAIWLVEAGTCDGLATVNADAGRHFHLTAMPGTYDLVLETANGTVTAPGLAFGEPEAKD